MFGYKKSCESVWGGTCILKFVVIFVRMIQVDSVYTGGKRYLWYIIDYLQKEVEMQGIKEDETGVWSFWTHLNIILEDPQFTLYACDGQGELVGYMVVNRDLIREYKESGLELNLILFEVLPKYRAMGYGREMINWVKEAAKHRGYSKINLEATDESFEFWKRMGFSVRIYELLGRCSMFFE